MSLHELPVVYELGGRSRDAAEALAGEMRRELDVRPSSSLADRDAVHAGLADRLKREQPELLELTGLTSPVVCVYKRQESWPRAYREYPCIFMSPETRPRYFMYAPVGYRGEHFVPPDARRLSEIEAQHAGNLLFAGGWLGNAPVVELKKAGVPVPSDYQSPSARELREVFGALSVRQVAYVTAGRSLELVQDYRQCEADWRRSIKRASRAIRFAVREQRQHILAGLPAGEDININISPSYSSRGGDMVALELSIQQQGRVNIMHAGRRVVVPASPAYAVDVRDGRSFVQPRLDTPQGQRLKVILDAIPVTPALSSYPELILQGRAQVYAPHAVEVAGHTVLLYNLARADSAASFCPPDARRLPIAAFNWLRGDEGDRNIGIDPPPAPSRLAAILSGSRRVRLPAGPKPVP